MRYYALIILVLGVLLAACNGGDSDSEDPTEQPQAATLEDAGVAAEDGPTPTSRSQATSLPPTWTPLPDGFVASPLPTDTPTPRPETTLAEGRTPLPPTWTPGAAVVNPQSVRPTNTPTPTPTFTPTQPPPDDFCFTFSAKQELNTPNETIDVGEGTTIYWNPIPSPNYSYEVQVIHPDGSVVHTNIVDGQEYFIPAEFLTAEGASYGWAVTPRFDDQNTCFSITGEVYVESAFQ